MSKIQSIPIDGQKLRNEFEKRNINHYELAVQCGYSRKWFQNGVLCNYVTPPMLVVLREKLNITLDDIKPDPVPVKEEEKGKLENVKQDGNNALIVSNMTQGDLYETISDAISDAFRSVKSELQRVIFDAVSDSIRMERDETKPIK